MAAREITGADKEELQALRGEYYNQPLSVEEGIPFETAYCLNPIAKQPDHYDGEQRFCKRRAAKKDEEDYEGGPRDAAAFAVCCHSHGGDVEKNGHEQKHHLEDPRTAAIKHGLEAEDDNLIMDFDESEQKLFDSIMEGWPEIYDWPPQEEDPARYRILRRVAVNEVRSVRAEDYIDDEGEVHIRRIPTEHGEQTEEVENPLSREYRLLMSEVTDQMKELGLTPKERQKMDTLESQADKDDAVSDIASEALSDGDNDYDPTQFDDDG
jgi:hypothetical protein